MRIGMVTVDCLDTAPLLAFWSAALGVEVLGDYGDFAMLRSTPVLGFQKVDQTTPGKNRLHLDLYGGARTEEVARLVALGATELSTHSLPDGFTWTVLQDPAGNEFCVADPRPTGDAA